jgi:hypothetical protein
VVVIVNPNLASTRRYGSNVTQSRCPEGSTAIAFESRDRGQRLPPTTTVTSGAPLVGGRLGSGIVITPRAVDSAGSGICTCVPASRLFLGGRLLASNEGVTDCRGLASNTKMHRKVCCELTLLAVVALHATPIPRQGALFRMMADPVAVAALQDLLIGTVVLAVTSLIAVKTLSVAATTATTGARVGAVRLHVTAKTLVCQYMTRYGTSDLPSLSTIVARTISSSSSTSTAAALLARLCAVSLVMTRDTAVVTGTIATTTTLRLVGTVGFVVAGSY